MKQLRELNYLKNDGYAQLVAQGVDTLVETYKTKYPIALRERLDKAKEEADERSTRKKEPMTIQFGGIEFQIKPHGASGCYWIIENDLYKIDFLVGNSWNIQVRFSSSVLWQYGVEDARKQLLDILLREVEFIENEVVTTTDEETGEIQERVEIGFSRVSQIHYCFDFYAPKFDGEMKPEILHSFVCKSGIKKSAHGELNYELYMNGVKTETVTLGKKNNLQLQIYDKTAEIKDCSGKFWMYDLWKQGGLEIQDEDNPPRVWRVEFRFGKTYLKNRDKQSVRLFECCIALLPELINEAHRDRRLTRPSYTTAVRDRWPVHELWSAIYDAINKPNETLPLGRVFEQTRAEVRNRFDRGIAGNFIASSVSQTGEYDEEHIKEQFERVLKLNRANPDLPKKVILNQEKYKFIDQPK